MKKIRPVHKIKKKLSVGNITFNFFNYFILLFFTVLCIFPFYYLFINTISSNELSARGEIFFLPREIHFSNYWQVFRIPGLIRATQVSLMRTIIGTILPVLTAGYVGFMFTQPMWARRFWYRFVVASMYIHAGLIPWFLTLVMLGFQNSFWVYIIPGIMQPFSILLVKTYVESTPVSLQESAEMDGAGTMTIFIRIILPLIKPILATVAIFAAVGQWNAFMDTLLFITTDTLHTLQFVLYRYISQAGALARLVQQAGVIGGGVGDFANLATQQTATSVRMTVTIIVTLPILFVYPFFQKYFVQGIMIGAVKG